MKRQCWAILGVVIAAYSAAFGQEELVKQVEDALRANRDGAVYDLGKLMKPQGAAELRQLAEQFRADGLNFYFVTVPPGSLNPDALAESVYQDLNMAANDVLIVFDGKRVYGKAVALKGDTQAFRDAFASARPSFKLYHVKGLAAFAQSLRDRIVQRRATEAAERQATAKRRNLLWSAFIALILAIVGFVVYRRMRVRQAARQQYDERLKTAELLFQQIERKIPSNLPLVQRITLDTEDDMPHDVTSEFLRLNNDLERCRQRIGTTRADVDRLIANLQKLNSQLAEQPEDQSSSSSAEAIGDKL